MIIKICGITRPKDAVLARKLGADIIGMIFADSPRQVTERQAALICRAAGKKVKKAGVFVNEKAGEINRLVKKLGLDYVQLSGTEPPSFAARIKGAAIIKAIKPRGKKSFIASLKRYGSCDILILDTYSKTCYGGTGKAFNWNIIKGVRTKKPVLVAGGISAENAGELIKTARPRGIDASSGLESSPGKKSAVKMRKFFRKAGKKKNVS